MITREKLARRDRPVEYAPVTRALDPKIGPAGHVLTRHRYSTTPGGAMAKLRRHRDGLSAGIRVLLAEGHSGFVHQFLAELDRVRVATCHVELDGGAMLTIERRDAEDNVSRVRWRENPTTENAMALIRDVERAIESSHELILGVLAVHPELR